MKRIGLLSDTHGYLDSAVFKYFEQCDEIWHAGDIGTTELAEKLAAFKPLRAVYGNIDGQQLRRMYPAKLFFNCEGLQVLIMHIGGYPGKYSPEAFREISANHPGLFICGHSHILKVIPDQRFNLLHINPGAAGIQGFHVKKTLVRFTIDQGRVKDLEVIETGFRASRVP
jgi:putative phosphoesterase